MLGWEEACAPVFWAVGREAARIGEDYEGGEVVAESAQAVTDPCACAGEAGEHEAGGLHEGGGAVDVGFADDVVDEGDFIDDGTERSDAIVDEFAGLAVLTP